MSMGEHILISLDVRHATNILEGRKFVEFRRRTMNVKPGATIWIYAKLPVGSVVGRAMVVAVRTQAPSTLWRKFGPVSGLSRGEFFEYFEGVQQGTALELADCRKLCSSLPLDLLRGFSAGFQPPQFFVRLKQGTPLLRAISEADQQPESRGQLVVN